MTHKEWCLLTDEDMKMNSTIPVLIIMNNILTQLISQILILMSEGQKLWALYGKYMTTYTTLYVVKKNIL